MFILFFSLPKIFFSILIFVFPFLKYFFLVYGSKNIPIVSPISIIGYLILLISQIKKKKKKKLEGILDSSLKKVINSIHKLCHPLSRMNSGFDQISQPPLLTNAGQATTVSYLGY